MYKPSENDIIVKSNSLIEASYRLNLTEQQLVLFAIVQAREEGLGLVPGTFISISARQFAEQFGLNQETVYLQIKKSATTLWNRFIVVEDIHPESGKNRVIKSRWVSKIAYVEGAGIVQLAFSEEVIPFITRLEKKFTSYEIAEVSKMTSTHAIRVYELLAQYLSLGERRFELLELKKVLGVESEYDSITDFKKRVLDKSVSEINKHSSLKISYSQKKNGRVVTEIIFSIRRKSAEKSESKKPKKPVQLTLTGVDVVSVTSRKPKIPDVADPNDDGF